MDPSLSFSGSLSSVFTCFHSVTWDLLPSLTTSYHFFPLCVAIVALSFSLGVSIWSGIHETGGFTGSDLSTAQFTKGRPGLQFITISWAPKQHDRHAGSCRNCSMTLNISKYSQEISRNPCRSLWLGFTSQSQCRKKPLGQRRKGGTDGKGGKKARSAELCQDSVVKLLILRWGGQTLHTPRPHTAQTRHAKTVHGRYLCVCFHIEMSLKVSR